MLTPTWRVAFFLSGAAFLLALALPMHRDGMPGFSAAYWGTFLTILGVMDLLSMQGDQVKQVSLIALSPLANLLFIYCWLVVVVRFRRRRNRGFLVWLVTVAAILGFLFTLIPLCLNELPWSMGDWKDLRVGYYLWSFSAGLLAMTLVFGFRPFDNHESSQSA